MSIVFIVSLLIVEQFQKHNYIASVLRSLYVYKEESPDYINSEINENQNTQK